MGVFRKELVYALIVQITSYIFGFVICYPSPVFPYWSDHGWGLTTMEENIFNSISSLTAVLGPFTLNFLFKFMGRKMASYVLNIYTTITWVLLFFVTGKKTIWIGYIARGLQGIAMGAASTFAPLQLTEVAPEDQRGFYASINTASVTLAIIFVFIVGQYLPPNYINITAIAFLVLQMATMWLVPETKPETKVDTDDTPHETFCQKKYVTKIFIAVSVMILQQFTGPNAILTNMIRVFQRAKVPLPEGIAASLVMSSQVFSTILLSGLVDKYGRKIMWLTSNFLVGVSLLLFGLTLYLDWKPLLGIAFLVVFQIGFGLALGPMPWYLAPQMLPPHLAALAASILQTVNWCCSFSVIFLYPVMRNGMDDSGCFMFYSGVALFSAFYGYFIIPDPEQINKAAYQEI